MNKKISMSLIELQEGYSDRYALEVAKKIGLDGLDFSLLEHSVAKEGDLYTKPLEEIVAYYTDLKKYADELGIVIPQTHGRLVGFAMTPEGDEAFIRDAEIDCIVTRILGARYCVVHTPAITWVGPDHTDEELYDIGVRLFTSILPFAKREGVKIAAETHGDSGRYGRMEFFGYVDNLIELINRVRACCDAGSELCVCVDTGHTNMTVRYGNPSVGDVIRKLGSLVQVLHIHDNNGIKDQHKIPRTGIIDWDDVLDSLDEAGYQGWYNLENCTNHFGPGFEVEEADFSVKVIRQMLKVHAAKKNA